MSKTKLFLAALAMAIGAKASALTFGELAEKNARFLSLKADLAIAKTEAELAEQKRAKSGISATAGGAPVPAIQQGTAPALGTAPKAATPAPQAPEIFLNAIHGAEHSLEADFQKQSSAISRRRGDTIFDGWQLESIAYPRVKVVKRAVGKKQKDACKSVSIGASISGSPDC